MTLLRKRNRRKVPAGQRFTLPALNWPRLARGAAAVAALASVAWLLSAGLDQPIRKVRLDGSFQRVSTVEVEQVVGSALRGGFMSLDLDGLKRSIEALAWVDRARVQRRWPDTVEIEVIEQVPAARWGDDGLLNTRGELFMSGARHPPPELPRLDGPPGTEATVAQRYLAVQGRLLDLGLRLTALRLDARGAWEMDLSNGVTVRLGRSQVDQRMDRFLRVAAEVIAGRAADIADVDMRYSNGFSIVWRPAAGPEQNQAAAAVQHSGDTDSDA